MALKKCSKCGSEFVCTNEQRGCWCENLYLGPESLKQLSADYANCLFPLCLSAFADPEPKNTCDLVGN
ncbi:MAG: cysteine-rich CWC family protein [Bacteroidia bacterium]